MPEMTGRCWAVACGLSRTVEVVDTKVLNKVAPPLPCLSPTEQACPGEIPEPTWITKIYRGIKKRRILDLPPKICYGSLARPPDPAYATVPAALFHRLRVPRYPGVAGHMQVAQRSY